TDDSRRKRARWIHRCAADRAGKQCFQSNDGPDDDSRGDSLSRAPVETPRITNINSAVRISSRMKDWSSGPAGMVAPSVILTGKSKRKITLARKAPAHWLRI